MLWKFYLGYNSLHGEHLLVPEYSLRFQHKGTCSGAASGRHMPQPLATDDLKRLRGQLIIAERLGAIWARFHTAME